MSTAAIPDLWSQDIKVDVLSPLAILRSQESLLSRKTKGDRKSTRLNSSHGSISYAVFCLKKNNNIIVEQNDQFIDSITSHFLGHPASSFVTPHTPLPHCITATDTHLTVYRLQSVHLNTPI